MVVPDLFVDAIRRTLDDQRLDRSFIADAVTLPGLAFLGELMPSIDIEGLWAAQQRVRSVLSDQLADRWSSVYDAAHGSGPYRFTPEEVGRRRLRSTALAYLSTDKGEAARRRAVEYFEKAGNMTEQVAGLAVLAELGGAEGEAALASFWERWKGEPLVLDKWFGIQARTPTAGTLERVERLVEHPSYDRRIPTGSIPWSAPSRRAIPSNSTRPAGAVIGSSPIRFWPRTNSIRRSRRGCFRRSAPGGATTGNDRP